MYTIHTHVIIFRSSALNMTEYHNIVLLFGYIKGCPNVGQLSKNHSFLYRPPTIQQDPRQRWRLAVMQAPPPFAFCLAFNNKSKSTHGWVFGSEGQEEPDACDFQLSADGMDGVSRHHFRVEFSSTSQDRPRIVSLPSNRTKIIELGRVSILSKGEAHVIKGPAIIDLGAITMRIWLPTLTPDEKRSYRQNVQRFHEDFMNSRPISPENHKVEKSRRTRQVRFGIDGRNYIATGEEEASGNFGTVIQVKETKTG